MKAILSADLNWAIGKDGKLLARVPEDMKYFMSKTIEKVVVMGRKTYESFPNKNPLRDRVNIVLTRDKYFADDRVTVLNSVEAVLEEIKKYEDNDVFIIGGQEIYRQFLPYCDEVYITKFKKEFDADTFFANLDEDDAWEQIECGEQKEYKGLVFEFTIYKNKALEVEK